MVSKEVVVRSAEDCAVNSEPPAKIIGKNKVVVASAIFFVTFLGCCSMSLDQGLFQYYEKVLHDAHRKELQNALGFSLVPNAHDGSLLPERLKDVKKSVKAMFTSLPKNQAGRISVDVMRYMAHRYFSHKYSWIVKGFEPHRSNASISDVRILHSQLPDYCKRVLGGSLAVAGFSLDDVVTVLGGVEQLIFDEVVASTESAYRINNCPLNQKLAKNKMLDVVYSYLLEGMLEGNYSDAKQHAFDKENIVEIYPNWHSAQLFVEDVVGTDAFEKKHANSPYMRGSQHMYSFEETLGLTTRISREFGPWANYECNTMKESLSNLDAHGTGRVKLSDFWGVKVVKENEEQWIFQESSSYLKSLGALDESDGELGAQVIIPNYVYAMSNCIMSTPHYSVCCLNECENMMAQLESQLRAPKASSLEIMKTVQYLLPLSPFPTPGREQALNGTLRIRLEEIAAQNEDGLVPIHGRLFAQWLHYAFPRDCPYPHEAGSVNPMTPGEFLEAHATIPAEFAHDPTVVKNHDIEILEKQPEVMLPPSPRAGAKMWVAKEQLLTSSTASDEWMGMCLRGLAGMLLVTGLLISTLKSIRHLRKVLSRRKTTSGP